MNASTFQCHAFNEGLPNGKASGEFNWLNGAFATRSGISGGAARFYSQLPFSLGG